MTGGAYVLLPGWYTWVSTVPLWLLAFKEQYDSRALDYPWARGSFLNFMHGHGRYSSAIAICSRDVVLGLQHGISFGNLFCLQASARKSDIQLIYHRERIFSYSLTLIEVWHRTFNIPRTVLFTEENYICTYFLLSSSLTGWCVV